MVVRNPYLRLYSAYLQRTVAMQDFLHNYSRHSDTTRKIIDRHLNLEKKHGSIFLSFERFLQMLVLIKNTTLLPLPHMRQDPHFTSVWDLCHPCGIRYDYIAKFETLSSDSHLILPLLNETTFPHFNRAKGHLLGRNLVNVSVLDPIKAIGQTPWHILSDIATVYQEDLDIFAYGLQSNKTPYSLV
jgi:hypothetical protein